MLGSTAFLTLVLPNWFAADAVVVSVALLAVFLPFKCPLLLEGTKVSTQVRDFCLTGDSVLSVGMLSAPKGLLSTNMFLHFKCPDDSGSRFFSEGATVLCFSSNPDWSGSPPVPLNKEAVEDSVFLLGTDELFFLQGTLPKRVRSGIGLDVLGRLSLPDLLNQRPL